MNCRLLHEEFPVVKRDNGLSADDPIRTAKIMFTEFKRPKKIVSFTDMNFVLEHFKQLCRMLNIP